MLGGLASSIKRHKFANMRSNLTRLISPIAIVNQSRNNEYRRFCAALPRPPQNRWKSAAVWKELRESAILSIQLLIALTSGTMIFGFAVETYKENFPSVVLAPTKYVRVELLDIESSKSVPTQIHVEQQQKISNDGSQRITVLLDGSIGDTCYEWSKVAAQVGEFANVLAIDRPGLGYSGPGIGSRDAKQIASEYVQILTALNISGQIVLVGHASGGYNMRFLAAELAGAPSSALQCAGMVLLDASHEKNLAQMEGVSESVNECLKTLEKNIKLLSFLSFFAFPRFFEWIQFKTSKAKYSTDVQEAQLYVIGTTKHRQGLMYEFEALKKSETLFREQKRLNHDAADFPVAILSHDKANMFDSLKLMSAKVKDRDIQVLESIWSEGQVSLVNEFKKENPNRLVVHQLIQNPNFDFQKPNPNVSCIQGSYYYCPDVVTGAIQAMVNECKSPGNSAGLESLLTNTCIVDNSRIN